MKNHLLTIALLALFTGLWGQNWEPFVPGETHHFRSDTASFPDRSVRIDSARMVAGDSIWYFNRLFAWDMDSTWGLKNQPLFCRRAARVLPGGVFQLFDPDTLTIETLADTGDSWLIDTPQQRHASVVAVYEDTVMGSLDSLKVIVIDSLDSLVLSKSHGLMVWPASLGPQHYEKVGIQERHLGDTLPGFWGFFPYASGQSFYWHSEFTQADNPGVDHREYDWKMHVDSTERSATGMVVHWSGIMMGGQLLQGVWHLRDSLGFFVRRAHQEQVEIGDANMLDPYAYPVGWSNMLTCPANHYAYPIPLWSQVQFHMRHDSLVMHLGDSHLAPWNGQPIFAASLSDTVNITGDNLTQKFELTEGLGLTYASWTDFEISAFLELVGHIIGDDTSGTIWPDSVLLHGRTQPLGYTWQAFPNPAQDKISISLQGADGGVVNLISMTGQAMGTWQVNAGMSQRDLGAIPAGMYLLQLVVDGQMDHRKLVVER